MVSSVWAKVSADSASGEDLAGGRGRTQARCLDHHTAVNIAPFVDCHVPGGDPHPQPQPVSSAALRGLDRPLHRNRTPQRIRGTREGRQQPVTETLDLPATVLRQRGSQQPQMLVLHNPETLVTQSRQRRRGRHRIGEQNRKRRVHEPTLLPPPRAAPLTDGIGLGGELLAHQPRDGGGVDRLGHVGVGAEFHRGLLALDRA